jgi:hypothetical protein
MRYAWVGRRPRPHPRPRHQVPQWALLILRPAFRYSRSRDAWILRGFGSSLGPVVCRRTDAIPRSEWQLRGAAALGRLTQNRARAMSVVVIAVLAVCAGAVSAWLASGRLDAPVALRFNVNDALGKPAGPSAPPVLGPVPSGRRTSGPLRPRSKRPATASRSPQRSTSAAAPALAQNPPAPPVTTTSATIAATSGAGYGSSGTTQPYTSPSYTAPTYTAPAYTAPAYTAPAAPPPPATAQSTSGGSTSTESSGTGTVSGGG